MESGFCTDLIASWWDGSEVKECSLLGHKILIWGRFGKIAEFIAALVIVVDIIGAVRLNNFAQDLDKAVVWSSRKGGQAIEWMLHRISEVSGLVWIFASQRRRKAVVERTYQCLLCIRDRWYLTVAASLISGLMLLLLMAAITTLQWGSGGEFDLALRVVAVVVFLVPLVVYLITGVLVNALYLRFFRMALIQPAIWLLSRQDVVTFARIGSAVVLVVGFSFDLLSS